MKFYSIAISFVSHIDSQTALSTNLYDLFLYSIPWIIRGNETDQIFNYIDDIYDIIYSDRYHRNPV